MPEVAIDLQCAVEAPGLPDLETLNLWARTALSEVGREAPCELTVRVVDDAEITELNGRYRHLEKPTNILSFEAGLPEELSDLPYIGDLVICHAVVVREAQEQHKRLEEHYAHLIVHGCLHLMGYDHIAPEDAAIMEPLEVRILAILGFPDPYAEI